MSKAAWLALVCIILFPSGCAHIPFLSFSYPPKISPGAEELLDRWSSQNNGMNSFKGIGKAKLSINGRTQVARVAWLGIGVDQMRIEVLAITGQPIASYANDGQWVYLLARQPLKFYKKRASSVSLKKVLDIPVSSSELQQLITGRIPIRTYNAAAIIPSPNPETAQAAEKADPDFEERIMELKRFWGITVQRIKFDPRSGLVQHIEVLNNKGDLDYRASMGNRANISGYQIPLRIDIADGEGRSFKLNIQQYWADIPVDQAVFTLTPPNQGLEQN